MSDTINEEEEKKSADDFMKRALDYPALKASHDALKKFNEESIYLLQFCQQIIEDEELGHTRNGDNWIIGVSLEEHLSKAKNI